MYHAEALEYKTIQSGSLQQLDAAVWERPACGLENYILWASGEWNAPCIRPGDVAHTSFANFADDLAPFDCNEPSSTGSSPEADHFLSPWSSLSTDDSLNKTAIPPDCAPMAMHHDFSSGADTGANYPFSENMTLNPRGGAAFRSEVGSQAQSQAARKRRASARSPNRGFLCDQCHKTFTRKKNLTDHMERHRNLKAFWCRELDCQSRFNTRSDLERHVRTVHTANGRPNKRRA
ncbi:uncharacterized protein SCHCODRAFT_02641338 [Schizophyllum commune H4-8]|uniref:uncharacterized protein n=1 Tax=Schizophyllum commune (strain H4-8 / FGSC 9210) TaxID=578458 RepID=UPI00215EDB1B|nr:uncharacterized protein SCHCODRAFT_02641338 [Schizophyllum commune H4-8]KAI5887394.1 hypothetical protein SCHCODRAFT_02641338 [Schizophyllum commune H4-8]